MLDRSVLATLETALVPGKRSRLSPFVESAQLEVLFGTAPDTEQHVESARAIVGANREKIRRMAECWSRFVREGKDFRANDYSEDAFLDAYLAYYFSVNVPKVQLVLLDLLRAGRLSGDICLVDVGVGTGTTAVAFLDFLLLAGQSCVLHGHPFPVRSVRLLGLDRSAGSLRRAEQVVKAYAAALARRIQGRAVVEGSNAAAAAGIDLLMRIQGWATEATWRPHDLDAAPLPSDVCGNLIVLGNVLNELSGRARKHVTASLHDLAEEAVVAVIEPGSRDLARQLMRWRRSLLANGSGLAPLGPCGQEFGQHLPDACNRCWISRREAFQQTPLFTAFHHATREFTDFHLATREFTDNQRRFDEFDNKLLSWSYALLHKTTATPDVASWPAQPLRAGMRFVAARSFRYVGAHRGRAPAHSHPDHELQRTKQGEMTEYLKLCPGHTSAEGIAIARRAGFEVPPLRFGELVSVSGLEVTEVRGKPGVFVLDPLLSHGARVERATPSAQHRYWLPRYDTVTRQTVDEIAYRLFGFTALRPFQHRILARVLTGHSVLGIAATGGGKSECFILPAMLLPGITVVVSPLKSLMTDQYHQRIERRYGLDHLTTYLNGDVSLREREARLKRLELGYYKLVYCTPEQLARDWVLASLKRAHEAVGIRYLAMDEAHCISQWGHDFRPAYLNLTRRLSEYGIEPVRIALTATASLEVRRDICEELELDSRPLDDGGDVLVDSSNRPELNLIVRVTETTTEKAERILVDLRALLQRNAESESKGAAIVFMPYTGNDPNNTEAYLPGAAHSRRGMRSARVNAFASFLERELGERVAIYHGQMDADDGPDGQSQDRAADERPLGDLSGRTRLSEQEAFLDDRRAIMVATKGFGMGIDKPNVRLVIHRTLTANLEAYAQEAGRAARDGAPADVILYYSNDRPIDRDDESNRDGREGRSDYEIQHCFLSEKYVRRQDVERLRAFLLTVRRRLAVVRPDGETADYLYFTNDEAIAFFDRAGADAWPRFPPREPSGREFGDHQTILDRGYTYENKTRYIDRILQVLYRIRPNMGAARHVAFLEQVQECAAAVVGLGKLNASAIVASNAYFGDKLRKAGVDAAELERLLAAGDLLPLAARLRLPLHETTALLTDIAYAEGQFVSDPSVPGKKRWESALLSYKRLIAPRWGPAAGKTTLADWREYAGAMRRALTPEAKRRARRHGGEPTVDDWFSWREVPSPQGWEVRLGPAFFDEAHWAEYLDAFMADHDRRERNDWEAFERLLVDYLGVHPDGRTEGWHGPRECLRGVLLGYLKTYEVVAEGNCRSCSYCEPDGHFEQDMDTRRRLVVPLGPRLIELFQEIEAAVETAPPQELVTELLAEVQRTAAANQSTRQYLRGWSGRLLQDTPDHRGALWVRARAMAEQLIEPSPQEFLQLVVHLIDADTDPAGAEALLGLLAQAPAEARNIPQFYRLEARLHERQEQWPEEARAWRDFLRVVRGVGTLEVEEERGVHHRLCTLHAANGPLPDSDLHAASLLGLARLTETIADSATTYAPLVAGWAWHQTTAELAACTALSRPPATQLGLLCAWVGGEAKGPDAERVEQVLTFLAEDGAYLAQRADVTEICSLIARLGVPAFVDHPSLATSLAEQLLSHEPVDVGAWQLGTQLLLVALRAHAPAAGSAWQLVRDRFLHMSSTDRSPAVQQAVLQLSLTAMVEGLYRANDQEFLRQARQLDELLTDREGQMGLLELLLRAPSNLTTQPSVFSLVADLARRLGRPQDESRALERFVHMAQEQGLADATLLNAYQRLRDLYAPQAPLENPAAYVACQRQVARFSDDLVEATAAYRTAVAGWGWDTVLAEWSALTTPGTFRWPAAVSLLCAWATADPDARHERAAIVVAHLTSEDGLSLTKQLPASALSHLVAQLGVAAFQSYPAFMGFLAQALLSTEKVHNTDRSRGVDLLLAAVRGGQPPEACGWHALVRHLVQDMPTCAAAPSVFEAFRDDQLLLVRLLSELTPHLSGSMPRMFEAWYDAFVPCLPAVAPKVALEVLRASTEAYVAATRKSAFPAAVLDGMQATAGSLLWAPAERAMAHRLWLRVLDDHPQRLGPYVVLCHAAPPPCSQWCEAILAFVLEKKGPWYIRASLESLVRQPSDKLPNRVARVVECYRLLGDAVAWTDIDPRRMNAALFTAIRQALAPNTSVERADMLVASIRALRADLNPNWKTPVRFEIEALCDARRFSEAAVLAQQHPDVVYRGQPAQAYIAHRRAAGQEERAESPYERDYIRVIRVCFLNKN
ncbi:MAG: DEAD/DEAH box helicase [Chloroflexi bacterium]|nr:DEAD/DEAH box helicase [Chloroflexota bacterium]